MVEPSVKPDPSGRIKFEMMAEVVQLLDRYGFQLPTDTALRVSAYADTITALHDLVGAFEGYASTGKHRNRLEATETMYELLGGADTARDLIAQLERMWSQ